MLTAGIDIGSTSSKGVIIEDGKKVLAKKIIPLGTGTKGSDNILWDVLELANLKRENIDRLIVTGYGRSNFTEADKQISEVSCHAKGVKFLVPTVMTVIDIGGQDAKALKLDEYGNLTNFVMNDKCAAGTGRFLDVMARIFDVRTDELAAIGDQSTKEITINNTCTVFAESEVISRLSANEALPDIVNGIHRSVAKRVAGLALRVGVKDDVVMSGGVALNSGVVKAMEKELKTKVIVPADCQLAGAYGAALFAWEELIKEKGND